MIRKSGGSYGGNSLAVQRWGSVAHILVMQRFHVIGSYQGLVAWTTDVMSKNSFPGIGFNRYT